MQRLLDAKGILRQTKRNRFTNRDDTLSALYKEVGVTDRTAQRRFELFDALKNHPDLMQHVDTGQMSEAAAKREVGQRQGNAKPHASKKTGNIADLARIIEHCIAKYLQRHDGIGAQVHRQGRQIVIDVCDGTGNASSSTEIFPLETKAIPEQSSQNEAEVVFDTHVAYSHAHVAQYKEQCDLESHERIEEHDTITRPELEAVFQSTD
jgi:hypothetical protein